MNDFWSIEYNFYKLALNYYIGINIKMNFEIYVILFKMTDVFI
jgi:hypothetical protein